MSGEVWAYSPTRHKTAHHGHDRLIYFGPRCQEVIRPFLIGRPVDQPLFSPREAIAERNAAAPTPRRDGQTPTPRKTGRRVGEAYSSAAYYRAIQAGCKAAEVPPWNPHRLRHAFSTGVRAQFGAEAARVATGHKHLKTTEIYAEREASQLLEIARKVG